MEELIDHFKGDRPYSFSPYWQNFDDGFKHANKMFRLLFWLAHSGNPIELVRKLQPIGLCIACKHRKVFNLFQMAFKD